jgi:hypothetical protein
VGRQSHRGGEVTKKGQPENIQNRAMRGLWASWSLAHGWSGRWQDDKPEWPGDEVLLDWSSHQPDGRLLLAPGLGVVSLRWIRSQRPWVKPRGEITLPLDTARKVFDSAVGGMDFGSGFLDDEEVAALRAFAVALGLDPMLATPSKFSAKYNHDFVLSTSSYYAKKGMCNTCLKDEDAPCHNGQAK